MTARSVRTPSYRLHKPSGQAVVTIDSRDFYLGRHDTPESRAEYDRLIAEWLASGRRLASVNVATGLDLTVNELCLAFLTWAEGYYRKNGRPTKEVVNIRYGIRALRALYGHTPARDFGPLALKAVRSSMIEAGLCRNEVNRRTRIVVRAFKWAVENEMVPSSVHHRLRAVSGLRKGRSEARESEPVRPEPEAFVEAVRRHVSKQVWAMIQLQRLSGMRPGEVCTLRTGDLDMTGRVWVYTPETHKTEHHGKDRRIYLGPAAQEVLRPWLRADLSAYLFSPREAMAAWYAEKRRARKSPVQPSQLSRAKLRPRKGPGERYTTDSYRRAIVSACEDAKVPFWHPNQLRHNAATRLRKEFGLDTARAVLGHSSTAVTEVYAELDREKAAEAMARVG